MEQSNPTKENIIHQAILLIKEKGFDQVTLNDICEASGISKHTFYYYFKSKEDVLMRFFHVPYELTTNRMSEIISMSSPVAQYWHLQEPRIMHFCDLGKEIVKRVMIINLQKEIGTFQHRKDKQVLHKLECDLIQKGQIMHEIQNASDPEQLSFALRVQMIGLISLWAMTNHDIDLLQESRRLLANTLDLREDVIF